MDDLDVQAVLQDSFTPIVAQIADSLSGLRDVMAEVAQALSDGFNESAAASGELRDAMAELGGSVQDAAAEMSQNTLALQEQTGALEENTTALQDNTAAQQEQGAAAEEGAAANDAASGSATKVAGMFGLAGLAAAGAGVALTVFGGKAQDSLNIVAALTGASQQQMDQYTAALEQMSGQLGVTMDSAAQGLYYVVSAGFKGSDAINVLRVSMEAAKAGGSDMQTTADALTSALNAYGASAQNATSYSDIMVEAVTGGKQTFADFASAIGMAAVTGHTAGFSFDQVAAAEATMTNSGLNAHRAVMQLDFLMRSIGLSADQVAAKAKKLGIDGFDTVAFKGMNLIQKLEYLQQISKGNKSAFETLVGGANGLSAAEVLLTNNGKTFNGILDQMHHSTGATAKAFATSESTMSAHAGHMGAALSVLALNFAQLVAPSVNAAFSQLTAIFTALATAITTHGPEAKAVLAGLAVVIGGALVAAVTLWGKAALEAAADQMALIGPILAVAAVVAILVTGVMLAYQHFGWFRDAVHAVGSTLGGVVHFFQTNETALDALKAVLAAAAGVALFFAASAIPPLVVAFGAWAVGAASAAVATIAATWPILAIVAAIAAVIFTIIEAVKHWTQIREAIGNFVSFVTSHLGAFFSWLGSAFHAAWSGAQHIVHHVVSFIAGLITGYFNLYRTIIEGALHFIVGLFSWLYNHNYFFKDLVDGIKADFELAQRIVTTVWTAITSFLTGVWKGLQQLASTVWHAVVFVIQSDLSLAQRIISTVWHAVTGFLSGVWSTIVRGAQTAWRDFTGAISAAAGAIGGAVHNAVVVPIQNGVSAIVNLATSWGRNLIQNLINGILSMAGAVGNAAKNIASKIGSFLGFHSPTEEGPGSTADQWMPALGKMLSTGLLEQQGPVKQAALQLAHTLHATLAPNGAGTGLGGAGAIGGAGGSLPLLLAGAGGTGAHGAGGGGSQEVHVHVHMPDSFVAGTRLLDRATRDQLAEELSQAFGEGIGIQGRLPYGYTGGR